MAADLDWTRQTTGVHVANHGGFSIVPIVKSKTFALHRNGGCVVSDKRQVKGTLSMLKKIAQGIWDREVIQQEEIQAAQAAQAKRDREKSVVDKALDQMKKRKHKPLRVCTCATIDFGQHCAIHGRKLKGGLDNGFLLTHRPSGVLTAPDTLKK